MPLTSLSTLTLTTLLTLTLLLISRLLSNYLTPGLQNIPGPILARFTNLHRFLDACKGHHHLTILHLHRKYGPVVRLGPKVVSISDPAAVDEILGLKANLDKSDQVKPMQNAYQGQPLPMLISARDAKLHARIRRPVAGAYSMTSVLAFEDVADECIGKMIEGVKLKCAENGGSCAIDRWMHFLALDFIGLATFDHPFGFLDAGKDVGNMLKIMDWQFVYIATLGNLPWLDYFVLKNPILLAMVETPNPLVDLATKCISERRSGTKESGRKDFLSRFLDAQQAHPESVSDLQVAAYTATNVLAASDTTGSALTSIIWMILTHPRVYAKLHRELDAANLPSPVPFAQAQKLPYLDAVIKETFRVFPTVGIELERTVGPAGLTLSSTGHTFPAGTIVGINSWPMQRDATIFGAQTDDFLPERWLQASDETDEHFDTRRTRMVRSSLNFGWGPRVCLGRHVALLEVYKTVATLFGALDLRLVEPGRLVKVRTDISVKISGLDVRVRVRDGRV